MIKILLLSFLLLLSACVDEPEKNQWVMDSISCFNSINDESPLEVWAISGTNSDVELVFKDNQIEVIGSSDNCFENPSYRYKYEIRDGELEGTTVIDYVNLTENDQSCVVNLNYFDGSSIDPANQHSIDLRNNKDNLSDNYFNQVSETVIQAQLPISAIGSIYGSCVGNCVCYGTFLAQEK
jgi:hypothetical protein